MGLSPGRVTLYVQVVAVTQDYLGPAADRFISRQVRNHLHIEPERLSKAELTSLIDWIRGAICLITEDSQLVEEYTHRLQQLTTGLGQASKRQSRVSK